MPKFDYRTLTPKERIALIDELVEALLTIKEKQDLRQFLQRLLTDSEIFMLARRLRVAELLIQGKSYAQIREMLRVGFSTIQSVDSWLEEAVHNYHDIRAEKKYQEMLDEMHQNQVDFEDMLGSFDDIRHRYSGPFLLLNLLLDEPVSKPRKPVRRKQ